MELIATYNDAITVDSADFMIPGYTYAFDYGILDDDPVPYIAVCKKHEQLRYMDRVLFNIIWRGILPNRPHISLFSDGIRNIRHHWRLD